MTTTSTPTGMPLVGADMFGVTIHVDDRRLFVEYDQLPSLIRQLLAQYPAHDLGVQQALSSMLIEHAPGVVGLVMRQMRNG